MRLWSWTLTSDLIRDILGRIPPSLAGNVALLNLGATDRRVGINLLDTRVFTDRDAAVAAVIEVAKGIWDKLGQPHGDHHVFHSEGDV